MQMRTHDRYSTPQHDKRSTTARQCVRGCRQRRSVISPVQTGKRNRRWPLAQSHQSSAPAVSSPHRRRLARRYQAREQKGGRGMEMERRLASCWPAVMDAVPSAPLARSRADLKRGCKGVFASLARRFCKTPRHLAHAAKDAWPRTGRVGVEGRSTPPREAPVSRNFP